MSWLDDLDDAANKAVPAVLCDADRMQRFVALYRAAEEHAALDKCPRYPNDTCCESAETVEWCTACKLWVAVNSLVGWA